MKAPKNIPAKGDTCTRRGRGGIIGVVTKVDPPGSGHWCQVLWDGTDNAMMCHLWELEKVETATHDRPPLQL
jgi:hypothetical protein